MQAFETEGLIGTGAAPAVLAYLFHRIEGAARRPADAADRRRGLARARRPGFGAQLREWLKTLRKKNASVVFATQSLADIEASAIAPAIIESCPTRLFLPNERAIEPQITRDLSPLRPQRSPDRDPRPRDAQARLLLPVAARQPPVRAGSRRGRARLHRRLVQDRSGRDRRVLAEHGRDGFAAAWLRRQRPRLGRRSRPQSRQHGGVVMIRHALSSAALIAAVFVGWRCRAMLDRAWADRLRSVELRPERAAGRPRAAADQQPDHGPAEPDADAAQPGAQSREPAVLLAAAISSRCRGPSSCSTGPASRLRHPPDRPGILSDLSSGLGGSAPIHAARQRAQARWQKSLAASRMLSASRPAWCNLDTTRTEMAALVSSSQSGVGPAGHAGGQPAHRLQTRQLARSDRAVAAQGLAPRAWRPRSAPPPGPGARAAPPLPRTRPGLPARQRPDVPAMKARLRFRRESAQPHGDAAGLLLRRPDVGLRRRHDCSRRPSVALGQSRAGGWSASECRRRSAGDRTRPLPHHHAGAERIRRHLPPRLGGKPAPVSRAVVPTPERRGE